MKTRQLKYTKITCNTSTEPAGARDKLKSNTHLKARRTMLLY